MSFLYGFPFSLIGTYFLNLPVLYIALHNCLVMNGAWFTFKNFFFKGACFSAILENTSVISL